MKRMVMAVAALALASQVYATPSGYWQFNEGANGSGSTGAAAAGTVLTNSVSGGINGSVTTSSGVSYVCPDSSNPSNLALELTGGYATFSNNVAYNLSENSDYTIEIMVKVNAASPDGDPTNWIINKDYANSSNHGWGLGWNDSTGKAFVNISGTQVDSTSAINDGQWHSIVVTHAANSATYTLYIDRAAQATLSTGLGAVSNGNLLLGTGYGWQTPRCFYGDLDEFRITTAVLSTSQFVPEPATLGLLGLGLMGLLRRKR
jgi:hypothetical protein